MKPIQWLLNGDTGISSKTIFAVLVGATLSKADVPYDSADFGRCYRLLEEFPEWRQRLPEVAAVYPIWGPMVAAWDELTAMYEDGIRTDWEAKGSQMYQRMRQLVVAGRLADGWENPSPGYWRKNQAEDIKIGPGVSMRT